MHLIVINRGFFLSHVPYHLYQYKNQLQVVIHGVPNLHLTRLASAIQPLGVQVSPAFSV